MQFGVSIPNRGPLATPETIREIATVAERLGYGYITVSDHIVVRKLHAKRAEKQLLRDHRELVLHSLIDGVVEHLLAGTGG